MIDNPFKFGREVYGDQFYDRQEPFDKLYRKLSGGSSNVVMYAPRRYGKTSLVTKVLNRFRDEGVPCIYFDLNRVETLERFCEEYASAVSSLAGRGREIVQGIAEYISHLHPTFQFGGELPVSVKLNYGGKMTATKLSEVLDLAEKVAEKYRLGPVIVAFDEFQEIANLSSSLPLEGIFRSVIQKHQSVRYLFLGSKTHMLKRMFGDKTRPFYKSAATLRLDKPPENEGVAFVASRFASRSIGIDEATAREIVRLSENIPYYLQELASLTFDRVKAENRDWVEARDVAEGVKDLVDENADYYCERLQIFSPSQRILLTALARESTSQFSTEYRERHSLGVPSTVHTALKVLIESGVVETSAGRYYVGDPFFARFIRTPASK